MELNLTLVVVGVLGVTVAALSARIRRLPLSEPLLGLVVGMVLGAEVTGVLSLPPLTSDHKLLHDSSRMLLAISVMAVALRYPIRDATRQWRGVLLLLLVAMPAMALLSGAVAWTVLAIPVATAALLGAAMAPTDPVLAASVVTGKAAEEDLPAHDRQLLSLESGANDGLALPLVLVALAIAGPLTGQHAAGEAAYQVVGAAVVGLAVGWAGGRALKLGEDHGATEQGPMLLFTVVLALGVLGLSGLLKVDGIFAVFVSGLAFSFVATGRERDAEVSIDEAVNRFAVLPLFVLLGATVPWHDWAQLGWHGPALVVGVLLLRRIPVLLLLGRPLGLKPPDAAYLGWFGPVGVSAIFYLTLEADRMSIPPVVLAAGSLVVVGSTVAHGLTSAPGRALYRRAVRRDEGQPALSG